MFPVEAILVYAAVARIRFVKLNVILEHVGINTKIPSI